MTLPPNIIVTCADLCRMAYEQEGDTDQAWGRRVRSRLSAKGFTDPNTWIVNDAELLAATLDKHRMYAFRGSSSVQDWLSNLRHRRVAFYQVGKIHAGMCYDYRSLATSAFGSHIEDDVIGNLQMGNRIVLTGHSRGAGLATVMAAMRIREHQHVHALVTFGSPRVCDAKLASFVHDGIAQNGGESYRFVNRCDLVTGLPTPMRFRHVDRCYYRSRDGSLKIRPSFTWVLIDRMLLAWSRWRRGETDAWCDHSIEKYLEMARTIDKQL